MLQITVVGKIVHVEEQQLMTLYTIDDGTGRLLAKYWTPNDDDDYVSPLFSNIFQCTHPRHHGGSHMRLCANATARSF